MKNSKAHHYFRAGHGIRSCRLPQRTASSHFTAKVLLALAFAVFWSYTIVSDCLGSFGNESSTVSAQFCETGSHTVVNALANHETRPNGLDLWAAAFVPMKPIRRRLTNCSLRQIFDRRAA